MAVVLIPEFSIDLCQELLSKKFDSAEEQASTICKFIFSSNEAFKTFLNLISKAKEFDTSYKALDDGTTKSGRILFPQNICFPLDRKQKYLMPDLFYYLVGKSIRKLKLMGVKELPKGFMRGLKENQGLELLKILNSKPIIPDLIDSIKSFDKLRCSFSALRDIKHLLPNLKLKSLFLDIGEAPMFDILQSDILSSTNFENFGICYGQTPTYFSAFCIDQEKLAENLFNGIKNLKIDATDVEFHRKRIKPEYFDIFGSKIFKNLENLKVEYTSQYKGNALRTFNFERATNIFNIYQQFCEQILKLPEKLSVNLKGKHVLFPMHTRRPEQGNVQPFVELLIQLLTNFSYETKEDGSWKKQYIWKIKNHLASNKIVEFSIVVFQFDREKHINEIEMNEEQLPGYSSSENEEDDEEMLIDKKPDDFDLDSPGSEDDSDFDSDDDDMDFELNA